MLVPGKALCLFVYLKEDSKAVKGGSISVLNKLQQGFDVGLGSASDALVLVYHIIYYCRFMMQRCDSVWSKFPEKNVLSYSFVEGRIPKFPEIMKFSEKSHLW